MRRPPTPRRPAPASRLEAEPRRPLWRRPLTLIFRARRDPPPAPAAAYRCAGGGQIILAARLQVAVHLWTRLGETHRHSAIHLHKTIFGTKATTTRIFRSSNLHLHRQSGFRESSRAPADGRRARRLEPVAGRPDFDTASLPDEAVRAARLFAPSAPASLVVRDERRRPRLHRALAQTPPPSRRSTAPGIVADPALRLPERGPAMASVRAARMPVVAGTAGTLRERRPASPDLLASSLSPRRGPASPDALPSRRAGPEARLDLAAPRRSRSGAAPAGHDFAPARRAPPPPPLDYRRPAPPPAAAAAGPEPRLAPPPAPSIDVDALSREVIGRIEKRLRIERERHGRV